MIDWPCSVLQWYVVCSLGLPNVCLVFMSMGLLQSVAACTLSMLLQHIRRYIVIGTSVPPCGVLPPDTWHFLLFSFAAENNISQIDENKASKFSFLDIVITLRLSSSIFRRSFLFAMINCE